MGSRQSQVMLDLETLGTGKNAFVVSIAAVEFLVEGDWPSPLPVTFDDVNSQYNLFHTGVSLDELDKHGRKKFQVTGGTLRFWSEQPTPMLRRMFSGTETVRLAARTFIEWYEGVNTRSEEGVAPVWANGATFDVPIMENFIKVAGYDCPFDFRAPRDVRTVVDWANLKRLNLKSTKLYDEERYAHDPVFDCMRQIYMVQEAFSLIGRPISDEDPLLGAH